MTTATAEHVNNSKMTWNKKKDEHGATFYMTDDRRYKVYADGKGKWIPVWMNSKIEDYDWCLKEKGGSNKSATFSDLSKAFETVDDFHEDHTGIKVRLTNWEDFTNSSSHVPTASVKSTVSKPVIKEETMATASAPPSLTVDRDEAIQLCVELGWPTADRWSQSKMNARLVKKIKMVLEAGEKEPQSDETLKLSNKIMKTVENGGRIFFEGDFPEDPDEPAEVVEETPSGEETEEASKKRGRTKKSETPESGEVNEDSSDEETEEKPTKRKGKRKVEAEPVNTEEVLELCQPMELSLSDLKVDRSYQRPVIESHVKKILKRWNPIALTALIVAERDDGTYYIVDGLQRSEAMKRRGMGVAHCMVFKSEGAKYEANIFDLVNALRKSPSKIEIFNAEYTAGADEPMEITRIVQESGFTFGKPANAWPKLECVQALRKVYRLGQEELLALTLTTIKAAWNGDVNACREIIVYGVGDFLKRYSKRIPEERINMVLKKKTPDEWVSSIKNLKQAMGGSRHLALGTSIVTYYNDKYKKSQIPNLYIGAEEEAGPRSED